MRYFLNSQFAPSIEMKGVDVVRRVSVFKSVTISVTKRIRELYFNQYHDVYLHFVRNNMYFF